MERRTFDKIVEEKVENAEYVVESAKEYNVVIPGLSEMEAVLKNPVEAVKEEVVDLANLAASVHEIGLPTEDPAVERFAKEKLGMQKLDNSQKVYVSLPKKDYIEPAVEKVTIEENQNIFQKILNIFMGN